MRLRISVGRSTFLAASLLAAPAFAQSWSVPPGATHALTPPTIAGDPSRPSAVSCIEGELYIEPGHDLAIDVFTPRGDAASITVDGTRFATKVMQLAHGTGILVPQSAIPALKSGNRMEIEFPAYGRMLRSTYSLKGSSKALNAPLRTCGMLAAANDPAGQGSTAVGAAQQLRIKVADTLTPECRDMGGTNIVFEPGAVREEPAADPAHPDVLFNFDHIQCHGAMSVLQAHGAGYCGAGPCLQRRYSYGANGYAVAQEYYQ